MARMQFQLRTVLALTAIFSLLLARYVNRRYAEQRAIDVLQRRGMIEVVASLTPDWVPSWISSVMMKRERYAMARR